MFGSGHLGGGTTAMWAFPTLSSSPPHPAAHHVAPPPAADITLHAHPDALDDLKDG